MGDWTAAANEIGWYQTMQALADQQAQSIYDPLWQAKPVRVQQNWCYTITPTSMIGHEPSHGIEDQL